VADLYWSEKKTRHLTRFDVTRIPTQRFLFIEESTFTGNTSKHLYALFINDECFSIKEQVNIVFGKNRLQKTLNIL